MTTRRMSARLQLAAAEPSPAPAPAPAPGPKAASAKPTRARKQPASAAAARSTTKSRTAAAAAPAKAAPARKRTRSSVEDDDDELQGSFDAHPAPAAKRARSNAAGAAAAKAVQPGAPVTASSIGSTRASRLRAASTAATTAAKSVAAAKEKAKVTAARKVAAPKKKAAVGTGAKVDSGKAKPVADVNEQEAESDLSDLEAEEAAAGGEDGLHSQQAVDEDRQRTIRFAPEPIVFDTSKEVADRPPPRRVASKPPAATTVVVSELSKPEKEEKAEEQAEQDVMDVDAPTATAAAADAQPDLEGTKEPAAVSVSAVESAAQHPEEDRMQVDSEPTHAAAAVETITPAAVNAAPSTPTKPAPSALPAHLSTPSRPTPLKSAMRTPNTLSRLHLTPGRTATFSPRLTREAETYSPAEYDRSTLPNMTKDLRSAGKINRENWIGIIRSVDKFKVKEMQVHPESKGNTRVHMPGHLSPGTTGEADEEEQEQEEFRLFDGSPLKAKTTVGHVNIMEAAAASAAAAAAATETGEEGKVKEHAENGGEDAPATIATPAKQPPVTATPNTRRVLFPLATNNTATRSTTPAAKGTPTKVVESAVVTSTPATPLKSPGRLIGSVIGTVGSLLSRLTPSRKSVEDLVAERQRSDE